MKSVFLAAMAATLATALIAPGFAEESKGPPKPDLAKGAAISQQTCGACHAADGSRGAPTYPILQGQHADYLVKQLTEFKSGKRDNAIMKGMATPLSEDDMRNVAAFYASKSAKEGFAKHADYQTAEHLWRGGASDRAIPACAGCHGPTGMGIPAQYPRLSGQHADYVYAQLSAFAKGGRKNSPQMAAIAMKMTDAEMKAIADYATGLH
jgi:cytochrome c553